MLSKATAVVDKSIKQNIAEPKPRMKSTGGFPGLQQRTNTTNARVAIVIQDLLRNSQSNAAAKYNLNHDRQADALGG